MKKLLGISIVAIFLVNIIVSNSVVYGYVSETTPERLVDEGTKLNESIINELDPTGIIPIALEENKEGFVVETKTDKLVVPDSDAGNIEVISDLTSVEMSIPLTNNNDVTVDGNTFIYSEENVSIGVQAVEGGVRQLINIDNNQAPHEYNIDFVLPEGGYISFAIDPGTGIADGSVLVYDVNNEILGAIDKPWAVDATGTNINTYYVISGLTLTQVVEHDNSMNYPILADPYYIYSYFDSGKWITRDGKVSLSLVPNWSLRSSMVNGLISWAVKDASWNAVKKDFYWDYKWYNTQGLYDQYVCHFDFAFFKSEFNLEPSRRSVGYWSTVASKCNP